MKRKINPAVVVLVQVACEHHVDVIEGVDDKHVVVVVVVVDKSVGIVHVVVVNVVQNMYVCH